MKISTITLLSLFTGVNFVSAQTTSGGYQLLSLLGLAQTLVRQAVPFLIGVAMVAFFYGLVLFIWKGKEGGDDLAKSKKFMINSILAMFVMVSIWGIIALMQSILGIDPGTVVKPPVVP